MDIKNNLLAILQQEKRAKIKGGIYHRLQIVFTYNSNRIEGSQLTEEHTRNIYETNTIDTQNTIVNVDDIMETTNHFRAIDYCLDNAMQVLDETIIKLLHKIVKGGTTDARLDWFRVGDYKTRPNEVSGQATTPPNEVATSINNLLVDYNAKSKITVNDIIDFHYHFESIHPFQDGNGRVGRLIILKECLKNNIVPFVITESHKPYYYRGLKEYPREQGYLRDTCLSAQDIFKQWLDYFEIGYN